MNSVLHITWKLSMGGKEGAVANLACAQKRAGLETGLLVTYTDGPLAGMLERNGVAVHLLPMKNAHDFPAARGARGIFERYDILHFHSAEPLLMRQAAACAGARLFYTHRAGLRLYRGKKWIRYVLTGYYLRRCFEGISGNTGHAAAAAAELFSIDRARIATIYNGIDFSLLDDASGRGEAFREMREEGDAPFRVGTCAVLRGWKRVDRIFRAIERMNSRTVRCYVIGEGVSRPALEGLARELGIERQVRFVGGKREIGGYLAPLDAFVLASGPEESFGNAAVEAMGLGIPTIVFQDGGGLLEHIKQGETGIIVRSVEELATALDLLARDTELRRRIGSAGREYVRGKYTTEEMVRRHALFYGIAA